MNLPNKITLARILLIPAFLVIYLAAPFPALANAWVALVLFVIAASTDALDGYLARRLNLVSNFGKLIDPLADKMLVCAVLIAFTYVGAVPAWATILIVVREFYISGFRQLALEQNFVMAATGLGKLKTIFQITLIVYILLPFPFDLLVFTPVTYGLIIVAVVFTIWSAADYTFKNLGVFKTKED
ncbi:MAG: CDP-diacylglycerol--glycerol-3-phosphate 3-phosphatidyltransferase [Defluviitaleaceae bacterium]|nr:CDP-diacylglycerol--glycerol-3-phosphate 3-phosphatidyltransferase [Defluviitaleaceae bacterium]